MCLIGCEYKRTDILEEYIIEDTETFISLEEVTLVGPGDISVDATGTIYILDTRLNQIVKISRDKTETTIIGETGEGPGEFIMPVRLFISHAMLIVLDMGTGRIEVFDQDGNYLIGYAMPYREGIGSIDIVTGEEIIVSTNGHHDALVAVFDFEGNMIETIGDPIVDPADTWDFEKIKSDINRGNIPDEMRNTVLPVLSEDNSYWIVHQTEQVIQKYNADGSLISRNEFHFPETDLIKQDFFRRNREISDARFFPLMFYAHAEEVNDQLWLLLNHGQNTQSEIIVISRDGEPVRKLVFPNIRGARKFTVDHNTNTIYFVLPHTGSVKSAYIPDS